MKDKQYNRAKELKALIFHCEGVLHYTRNSVLVSTYIKQVIFKDKAGTQDVSKELQVELTKCIHSFYKGKKNAFEKEFNNL